MSADLKVYLTNLGALSVSMTNIDASVKNNTISGVDRVHSAQMVHNE